jgi:hypothetical protein
MVIDSGVCGSLAASGGQRSMRGLWPRFRSALCETQGSCRRSAHCRGRPDVVPDTLFQKSSIARGLSLQAAERFRDLARQLA